MSKGVSHRESSRSEISRRNETDPHFATERRLLGHHLRKLRTERNLTQEAAAEQIGLHPIHLGRLEGGSENVTFATLIAISLAYGVAIRDLFEGDSAGTSPWGPASVGRSRAEVTALAEQPPAYPPHQRRKKPSKPPTATSRKRPSPRR